MFLGVLFWTIFSSHYLTLDILSIPITFITTSGLLIPKSLTQISPESFVSLPNQHLKVLKTEAHPVAQTRNQRFISDAFLSPTLNIYQFYLLKFSPLPTSSIITSPQGPRVVPQTWILATLLLPSIPLNWTLSFLITCLGELKWQALGIQRSMWFWKTAA